MIKEIKAYELYCNRCGAAYLNEYGDPMFCRDRDNLEAFAENEDGESWQYYKDTAICHSCIMAEDEEEKGERERDDS